MGEPVVYKEENWVPRNIIGVANRSDIYTPIVYYENGGMLITDAERYADGHKYNEDGSLNKWEYNKYKKEQQMAKVVANAGHIVEHLAEKPRISSADVRIDGELADFKKLSSSNNIRRHATYAVNKQKAKKLVFQFDKVERSTRWELVKLAKKGIHGYYFKTGSTKVYTF